MENNEDKELKKNSSPNEIIVNYRDKFIDKIYKFITKEKREIIGNLKAYNKDGNFYLTECVEVFNKKGNNFATNELFENSKDHQFYYETDNYQYQYMNNCVFPLEEIGDIFMLKDEVYDNYKKMLDKYYEENKKREEEEKKEKEEKEKKELLNDNNKNNQSIKDINDEILENIKKEGKKKKRKKKKK